MLHNLFYLVLAAIGLGFLVFIHELGHYFMARRVGMTVEAFGIGFGKPVLTWKHKGVDWHLNWLPFGGYVRIAGMEKKGHLEPYQIPDGFYGKRPLDRIKVALMGPVVNIIFALAAFTVIWATGGREKNFSESTHVLGWVDPNSQIYKAGVRAGDKISALGGRAFDSFNDLIYTSLLDSQEEQLSGEKINYETLQKQPFTVTIDPSQELNGIERPTMTIGTISPARYLIYDSPAGNAGKKDFPVGAPMELSGIQPKDRVLAVDGELVFSSRHLSELINAPCALLTVQRGDSTFASRVPRLKTTDLRLNKNQKAELDDWHHAAGLAEKSTQMYYIPYNLNVDAVVESPFHYIDENSEEHIFEAAPRSYREIPLQTGDRIVAVDGLPVSTAIELLQALQSRKINIIVERGSDLAPISWKEADKALDAHVDWKNFSAMVDSIGTLNPVQTSGRLQLLNPVRPVQVDDLSLSVTERAAYRQQVEKVRQEIEAIKDAKLRAMRLKEFEDSQRKLLLGISLLDRPVIYNPSPFKLFGDVFEQTWRTLSNLFSGTLSPKWLSGPIGIVQAIHYGWMVGVKEALFWMAMISLNLGIINLLPLPVLDGGHICFSMYESITKQRIKAKTMERMIIPFIILIVGFFIFVTYHDIVKIFSMFQR